MTVPPPASGMRAAAAAVARRVQRHHDQYANEVELCTISQVTPLMKALLVKSSFVLVEGRDFTLTQFVRWWDANYALQKGDALLLTRLPSGSWIAFDVLRTNRGVTAGIRPSRPPAAAGGAMRAAETSTESGLISVTAPGGGACTVTWAHHIAKKLEVFDKDGNRIGYVPVFTDLA